MPFFKFKTQNERYAKMYNNNKHKPSHYCRICGLKINQGNYCMAHRQNYLHDHYASSTARYDRLKKSLKRISQLLQIAPALEWDIDEAKLKIKISKLQAKLQEMEKLKPELKKEN